MHAASATPTGSLTREPVAPRGTQTPLVPAVHKALCVLDRLAAEREPMSASRLALALNLPKSSVHGLCLTLLSHGYLRREHDGAFRLGPRVMALAEAFVSDTDVVAEFSRLWPDAAAAPANTVVLSVLQGNEVIYLAARQGNRPLGLAFKAGMRLPAALAASGKSLLAYQSDAAVRKALIRPTGIRAAAARLPALPAFLDELAQVRAQGYSIDDEGVREGVYCIAAPVFDAAGQPVAGLGMCVLKTDSLRGAESGHRQAVLDAAALLTRRIGGVAPTHTLAPPFSEPQSAHPAPPQNPHPHRSDAPQGAPAPRNQRKAQAR